MARFKGFQFNLLPPKSKELVKKEDKRSFSMLYAALLIFTIVALWLGVNLVNAYVDSNIVTRWEKTNRDEDAQIVSYQSEAEDNYELYVKSQGLSGVVTKHTDPDLVFNLIDLRIKESTPGVNIVAYSRNSSGHYQITGTTKKQQDVATLINDFLDDENIKDITLLSLKASTEGNSEFILDIELSTNATEE